MGKRKSRNLLLLARTWIRLNHVATCMVVAGQTKKLRRMAGVDACDHLLYIPYWPEEPYRLDRLESPVARSAPEGIRNSTIGARHSRVAHVDKSKRNNEKDEMFCPFQMTTFHIRRRPGLYIYTSTFCFLFLVAVAICADERERRKPQEMESLDRPVIPTVLGKALYETQARTFVPDSLWLDRTSSVGIKPFWWESGPLTLLLRVLWRNLANVAQNTVDLKNSTPGINSFSTTAHGDVISLPLEMVSQP